MRTGTNIGTALKYQPIATRQLLLAGIKNVCDFLDFKKRLSTDEDYIFCFETLVSEFPAMTLEDWVIILGRIKMEYYGEYYERLKVGEFRKAFLKHDSDRQPYVEQMNTEHRVIRGAVNPTHITFQPQSMADIRRKRNAPIFALAQHLSNLNPNPSTLEQDSEPVREKQDNLEPDGSDQTQAQTG